MSLLLAAEASLSSARLAPYRLAAGEGKELILGRYLWNMAIVEALQPTLSMVEVVVRNTLNGAIATVAGPEWFNDERVLVSERSRADIADAKARLADLGRTRAIPDIIAAVDFGFWTGLCNREYEQGVGRPPGQIPLWPAVLQLIRTGLPQGLRTREALSAFLGRVRILRNRASHCEPMWRGHADRRGQVVPLSVDHRAMRDLVATLSPRVSDLLEVLDRFPQEFERGPEPWIAATRNLCVARGWAP